jgi:MFS family permease
MLITELISRWTGFLKRQESPFKINILKNLAQRFSVFLAFDYQSIYVSRLGASPLVLGYISSISGLGITLLSIPTGIIADRFGIKKIILLISTFFLISALIFGIATSWQVAAIAMVLTSIGLTLNGTLCPMICGSTLDSSERVTGMGICDTISFFPKLIAPLIGAYLITFFGGMNVQGIRPLYHIQLIGLVIAILVIYKWFENPSKLSNRPDKKDTNIFKNFREMISEGTIVKRWLVLTLISSFPRQVLFYVPLFAAEIKGANQFIIGGMATASTLVLVFLAAPLGHFADTYGRKKVLGISSGLVCLSYLLLIFSKSSVLLLISGFLSGFSLNIGQTLMAIGADLVPSKYLGSWFGVLGFFRGLIGILSPIICGIIWVSIAPQSVFLLLVFMQILSYFVILTVPTSVTK